MRPIPFLTVVVLISTFGVGCSDPTPPEPLADSAPRGGFEVTVTTTGSSLDPDGYTIWVEPSTPRADTVKTWTVGVNDVVILSNPGGGEVSLTGMASNCAVRPSHFHFHRTSADTFHVVCLTPIAFVSDRSGNSEIFVTVANQDAPVNLTNNRHFDGDPDWSPDGTKIAFTSNRDGDSDIFLMNATGSHPVNLTNHPADDHTASWSPDGAKLAFWSSRTPKGIYVMDADGSNQAYLGPGRDPAWSPDGTQIVFEFSGIFVMDADGSNRQRLAYGRDPAWSPDGATIMYVSFTQVGISRNYYLVVMNADGSNHVRVLKHFEYMFDPAWSLDGTQIVLSSRADQAFLIVPSRPLSYYYKISVVGVDGTNFGDSAQRLVPTMRPETRQRNDFSPTWQPRLIQ